ncbi:MAG: hydantoinase B/oxoprolinase family protein [Defluviicoccus sp.]|nr:hydantoinase B/oxoprolinase family protein [Defluviicoccus sp.]MDE0385312.1 hydantoinase B/oxoprolinase family protein [Defluviicoccus sp.]
MTGMLDPIDFEVLKHRLWQINDEQSAAIKTISASPIVVEGNDFNTGLFTAAGEVVIAGIGSVVHVTTMGDTLREIIRKAGRIRDGDIYLTNDPFMGALHQNDVVMASPVFVDGDVFMWIGNVLHHPDVGGIDEGSFCINARSIYQDPPRYFLKIVDAGVPSPEVEHTFVTNSRLPDMVLLDLGAQIGAINRARQRVDALIAERGPDTVRAVMERSIDVAEAQIRAAIAELPEGSWTGNAWMDGDRVGSERIHRVALRLSREGETLHFDYSGSSPQVDAAVNSTYPATVGGSAVPLFSFLCQGDIDWNEGLRRCMRVTAPEGSVVNASFPAPVSISTVGFRWLVTVAAAEAIARMFASSERYRDRVCPSWNSSSNCNNVFATAEDGTRVGALLSDHRGSGGGARSFADGFDHAGTITSFASSMGNVEGTEWKLPVLYVYRRSIPDSGGAGRYRGGLTAEVALIPEGADALVLKSTNTAGTDQTNAHGISGGYPGAGSQTSVVRRTGIRERVRRGEPPASTEDFAGEVEHLASKDEAVLGPDDALVFYPAGGGGYGDPLDRDPEAVAADVAEGRVSGEAARAQYGVVLSPGGVVDAAATSEARDALRSARREGTAAAWTAGAAIAAPGKHRIGEHLECAVDADGQTFRCLRCGHLLAGGAGSAILRRRPLAAAGPLRALRWDGDSPNFALEEAICPGCATVHEVREIRTESSKEREAIE